MAPGGRENELAALLEVIPERERLFFRFLAQTGLRIGEAVAINIGDADLGRRRVQVRRRWYRDNFGPPKSKYGRLDVPLEPTTARRSGRSSRDAIPPTSSLRRRQGG